MATIVAETIYSLIFICKGNAASGEYAKPALMIDSYDDEAAMLRGLDRQAGHECCTLVDIEDRVITGRERRAMAKAHGATIA
jgi:hypothetical protein